MLYFLPTGIKGMKNNVMKFLKTFTSAFTKNPFLLILTVSFPANLVELPAIKKNILLKILGTN